MTNSEKTVIYGLGALIAWELYQCCHPVGGGGCAPDPVSGQSAAPQWVQQLSQYESGVDYFTMQCGIFGRCYR